MKTETKIFFEALEKAAGPFGGRPHLSPIGHMTLAAPKRFRAGLSAEQAYKKPIENRVARLSKLIMAGRDPYGHDYPRAPLVKKAAARIFDDLRLMTSKDVFFEALEKAALDKATLRRIADKYKYSVGGGAAVGGLVGALKGRSDAMSFVTYHRLSEKDKAKMRRARMLSTGMDGAVKGAAIGGAAKTLYDSYR
jgi:hypothetical protein